MPDHLTELRANHPIIHCITNYVTANDCANLLLACGASPMMADAPEETAEIVAASHALVLNLGTLSSSRLAAMHAAGITAQQRGIPIVLDPVGVGASAFRRDAAAALLAETAFTAIRGNLSEIRYLSGAANPDAGVDARAEDTASACDCAKSLALRTNAIVIVTGAEDIVTDGRATYRIRGGHTVMRQITGAGCMLSALTGAFLAADRSLGGCAAAVCAMNRAGEAAAARMTASDGNASCRNYLIDAMFRMTDRDISEEMNRANLT